MGNNNDQNANDDSNTGQNSLVASVPQSVQLQNLYHAMNEGSSGSSQQSSMPQIPQLTQPAATQEAPSQPPSMQQLQMSDIRTKTSIMSANTNLNAFLNGVYSNLMKKKKGI